MPVYSNINGKLKQLKALPLSKEKLLQKLIEDNLFEVLEMNLLATEYSTTANGRIDTLAIDANGCPVIIEYKRNRHDNVIIQALSYLNWLKSQKVGFFKDLVTDKLTRERAEKIDWKNPRVVCIAESYNHYDLVALNEISNLELYKYHMYENDIFTLENVNGDEEKIVQSNQQTKIILNETPNIIRDNIDINLENHLNRGLPFIKDLFFTLQKRILELDENIQEKITNPYIGFKMSKNFVEVHIQKNRLVLHLRSFNYYDPKEKIFTVSEKHGWTLDRKVYLDNENELDYIMNLVEQSYRTVL